MHTQLTLFHAYFEPLNLRAGESPVVRKPPTTYPKLISVFKRPLWDFQTIAKAGKADIR